MLMILYGVAVALILVTIALALGTAWMKKKVSGARPEDAND